MSQNAATTAAQQAVEILGSEAECNEKLVPFFRVADLHPAWPMTTERVVELGRGNGYDFTGELVEGWIRRGLVPGVVIRSGRFAWSPVNVACALNHAEVWRRWIPLHPKHLHKLTGVELAEAQAQVAGQTIFSDLGEFDCNAFLELLAGCNDATVRRTFVTAMKSKLRQLGVLDS